MGIWKSPFRVVIFVWNKRTWMSNRIYCSLRSTRVKKIRRVKPVNEYDRFNQEDPNSKGDFKQVNLTKLVLANTGTG